MFPRCVLSLTLISAFLPFIASVCDLNGATREIDAFSAGIKTTNRTLVCQTVKSIAQVRTRVESLLGTCADDVTGLTEALEKFLASEKMAPNIANFQNCPYTAPKTEHVDRVGCTKSGLQKCADAARNLKSLVKDNPNATQTQVAKFCQLYTNPRLLEVCMEANFVKCSPIEKYNMRSFCESEKVKLRQLLFTTSLQLGCDDSEGDTSGETKCLEYGTLRSLLSCAPEVVSKIYSEQKIDWGSREICTGVSPTAFRQCAREKAAPCSPLRTLIEDVIYNVNIHCPELSVTPRNQSTPSMAQESASQSDGAVNTAQRLHNQRLRALTLVFVAIETAIIVP